jgi:hypothetical protein
MAATTTSVRPNRSPRVRLVWIVPVVVAIAVAVLVVNLSTELPSRETLTVRNPTAAPVTVHVSGADGGVLGIGTIDPRSTLTFEEVSDQGSAWRFRLSVGPSDVADLRRTDDELAAARWRVTIPESAVAQLPEARRPG